MDPLTQLVLDSENEIIASLTRLVHERGYDMRIPGTEDGVRRSVRLTSNGLAVSREHGDVEAPAAFDDLAADPSAAVGLAMVGRFRHDGLDFALLFGLLKCSRRAFADAVRAAGLEPQLTFEYLTQISSFFDRVELGFVGGWTDVSGDELVSLLRERNREMMEERNRYQSAFQSLPVAVLFLDARGKLFGMNAAAGTLFDQSERRWWPGVMRGGSHSEDPPVLGPEIAEFTASPDRERAIECELKTGKGTRFFLVEFTKLFDVGGVCTGMLVILNDLTYRRRAEEALRRSQLKYQALFENSASPTLYLEVVLDRRSRPADVKLLEANEAFSSLVGVPVPELVGVTLHSAASSAEPGEMDEYIRTLARVAMTGEPVAFEQHVPALGTTIRGQAFCAQPGYVGVIIDRVGE